MPHDLRLSRGFQLAVASSRPYARWLIANDSIERPVAAADSSEQAVEPEKANAKIRVHAASLLSALW